MFRSNPEREAEIKALSAMLREIPVGEVLPYADMTAAIGRDIQNDARISLLAARRAVELEPEGRRFETIRRLGVKRLETADIPGIGAATRHRISRIARRGHARLACVTANDMTPEIRKKIDLERSMLGAIALAATPRSAAKVEASVTTASAEIPAAVVLALMTK